MPGHILTLWILTHATCKVTQFHSIFSRIGPPIPDDDDSSEIPISTMLKHLCEM